MSDEKPIFKCVKSKNGSDNNWCYPEYVDISKDYSEEDIILKSIDDIAPLDEETKKKIIERVLARSIEAQDD